MSDPISNYSQWIQKQMESNRQHRIQTTIQGILAIRSLHLPYDITLQLIISYKYDLKKPSYKRSYNCVIHQLKKQQRIYRRHKGFVSTGCQSLPS